VSLVTHTHTHTHTLSHSLTHSLSLALPFSCKDHHIQSLRIDPSHQPPSSVVSSTASHPLSFPLLSSSAFSESSSHTEPHLPNPSRHHCRLSGEVVCAGCSTKEDVDGQSVRISLRAFRQYHKHFNKVQKFIPRVLFGRQFGSTEVATETQIKRVRPLASFALPRPLHAVVHGAPSTFSPSIANR
jgi:hypothetical protein